MTIRELAAYMIEHSDTMPVPEIDLETAEKYISWFDPDTDLPEDLNPNDFMVEWNSIVHEWNEANGSVPNWESIVNLMDDELRERVHSDISPCTEAEFLKSYMELHKEKYGEEFTW